MRRVPVAGTTGQPRVTGRNVGQHGAKVRRHGRCSARNVACMTPDEVRIIEALHGCSFAPGSSQKRFVRQMYARDRRKPLTDRQRSYLWAIGWSWRRQLPQQLVELAREHSRGIGIRGKKIHEAEMAMLSYWRRRAAPIIARVLTENAGKADEEIRTALFDAYPFGERAHHPYRIWLDEIKVQSGLKKITPTIRKLQGRPSQLPDERQTEMFVT